MQLGRQRVDNKMLNGLHTELHTEESNIFIITLRYTVRTELQKNQE
jgi:hypothetical protein